MTLFTQSFKHIAGVLFRNLKQLLRACKVEVLTLVCLQGRDWVNWMTREMKMRKLYLKQTIARDSQTDLKEESGSLSSGESDIGVDDDDEELLDDEDLQEGRGQGQEDVSQTNSLNDSDNDF
ncbi:hypothetical protein P5673_012198 [Acropora cervicornis]|uniref:Uncharacterized protein n=1 Tax=Acropora cervicornis TaxID=6130 RepID=A0AAD9QMJ4_ACRCE|nr:hypothetical protein P5673_012198 [Acropora cervicornis]